MAVDETTFSDRCIKGGNRHAKSHLLSEPNQIVSRPTAALAKTEIGPDHDMGQAQPVTNHVAREFIGGKPGQRRVERQLIQFLHTQLLKPMRPRTAAHQAERRRVRRKVFSWMRLEGHDPQWRIRRCITGQFDDRLVPQMDAIKIPDRNAGAAIFWLDKLEIPDDVHRRLRSVALQFVQAAV